MREEDPEDRRRNVVNWLQVACFPLLWAGRRGKATPQRRWAVEKERKGGRKAIT